MGEEVVYEGDSEKPIWGMNYYGVTLDQNISEEAMDKALRPALMKDCRKSVDKSIMLFYDIIILFEVLTLQQVYPRRGSKELGLLWITRSSRLNRLLQIMELQTLLASIPFSLRVLARKYTNN